MPGPTCWVVLADEYGSVVAYPPPPGTLTSGPFIHSGFLLAIAGSREASWGAFYQDAMIVASRGLCNVSIDEVPGGVGVEHCLLVSPVSSAELMKLSGRMGIGEMESTLVYHAALVIQILCVLFVATKSPQKCGAEQVSEMG